MKMNSKMGEILDLANRDLRAIINVFRTKRKYFK